MQEKYRERLTAKQIFSVPNILSYVRILLIPLIIVSYLTLKNYLLTVLLIIASGLTDVIDGFIARKFNMVTDFGKFIDPVADKLTQIALMACIVPRYFWAIILIAVMALKELLLFSWGVKTFNQSEKVNSARWYGKVCTLFVYSVIIVLFLSPIISLPLFWAYALIVTAGIVVIWSTVMYGLFYHNLAKTIYK